MLSPENGPEQIDMAVHYTTAPDHADYVAGVRMHRLYILSSVFESRF